MKDEDLEKIIGLTFIKGIEKFPQAQSKTELANLILKDDANLSHHITSYKSLINYFNYYFGEGKVKANPNQDTIDALLTYINYQSQKHFLENSPSNSYLEKVPFVKKEKNTTHENNKERYENSQKKEETKNITITGGDNSTIKTIINENKQSIILGMIGLFIIALLIVFFIQSKSSTPIYIPPSEPNSIIEEKNCAYWNGEQYKKEFCDDTTHDNLLPIADIKVNVNHFRKVYPTTYNEFFTSNGNPKIWYTYYYNQLEFFNAKGNHPITGEQLLPVNKKLVYEYLGLEDEEKTSIAHNDNKDVSSETQPKITEPSHDSDNKTVPKEDNSVKKSVPETKENPSTQTEENIPACQKNNTGDFCFNNTSSKNIYKVKIAFYRNNSPLASFYKNTTVQTNDEGCFYDLPIGAYSYTITRNNDLLNQLMGQFRVAQCKKSIKTLR